MKRNQHIIFYSLYWSYMLFVYSCNVLKEMVCVVVPSITHEKVTDILTL